jgi:Phosphotransferase enzyme family
MDAGVAARLSRRFPDVLALDDDLDRLAEICARLRRSATPRTAVHGDLWLGNVLLDGPSVSGVVDWEGGAASGEPVRDLVRFALMYALFLDRRTKVGRRVPGHRVLRAGEWGAGVVYALDGTGWFPDLFRRFLRNGLARLGASPASWRDAALAGIAETAALTDDGDFARLHLELFRRLTSERLLPAGARES